MRGMLLGFLRLRLAWARSYAGWLGLCRLRERGENVRENGKTGGEGASGADLQRQLEEVQDSGNKVLNVACGGGQRSFFHAIWASKLQQLGSSLEAMSLSSNLAQPLQCALQERLGRGKMVLHAV